MPSSGEASSRALSLREAIGGPWASNLTGWALLFFPSTILVFLLNANNQGLTFVDVLLLAVAQHLAAGVFALGLAALIRKRYRVFPLLVGFSLWILIGVTRGLVGVWFFAATTDVNPQVGWQVAFWVVVAVLWMPLFVYTAAQWEHRAVLASTRARLEILRDEERAHSIEPAGTVHKRLVTAVQEHINPVLDEIRRSLLLVSTGIDPAAMRRIGVQLAEVSRDAEAIVAGSLANHSVRAEKAQRGITNPLTVAVAFERKQSAFASMVTGFLLLTITLPVGIAGDGASDVVNAVAATVVTTVALVLRAIAHRIFAPQSHRLRGLVVVAAYATAGILGSITVLAFDLGTSNAHNWVLVLVFPVATVFAASLISGVVGLSQTNEGLALEIVELDAERHDLELIALVTEERVRSDLSTLLHGPVQGRLSACVMALNFHASELENGVPERVESITHAVVEHLQAASADLDSLGKTVLNQARP